MSLTARLARATAALAAVAAVTALAGGTKPAPPANPPVESAANPAVLVLQPDDRGVHGWVAGGADFAGKAVTVRAGRTIGRAVVGPDNTFFWPHTAAEPRAVTFRLAGERETLSSRVLLMPPAPPPGPAAFFVTDRPAYRPGHTLKFAAYLRQMTAAGEFEPVADRDVAVDLESDTKHIRAARLILRADALGKVTGSYTFTDADALDHYTLSIDGFAGSGRVLLGEYRKSKVALKIGGKVVGGRLELTFEGRDYLGRAVKGTSARFNAEVVHSTEPPRPSLDPAAFAHPDAPPPSADQLQRLPADQRLVARAEGVTGADFAGVGEWSVARREGDVAFGPDGSGRVVLDLSSEWLAPGYSVRVAGTLLDETGRESWAGTSLSLEPKPTRGVTVTVPRETVAAGRPVVVAVEPFGVTDADRPVTTLLVQRLSSASEFDRDDPADSATDWGGGYDVRERLPALTRRPAGSWRLPPDEGVIRAVPEDFAAVTAGKAGAVLRRPGAYKLVALTRLADGTVLRGEADVVARPAGQVPGVALKLDAQEVPAGSRLRGRAVTRFAGARLLLTLRDATGVRLTRPLTAGPDGVAAIDEPLPAGLKYGCLAAVAYPESAAVIHADECWFFAAPADRTVAVALTAPAAADAGAAVTLGVRAGRAGPTDLVVSVYDESLLSVSPDLSKDPRGFFLADARGRPRSAREVAALRVGDVAVAALVARAEKIAAELTAGDDSNTRKQLVRLAENFRHGRLGITDVATLLRLAGHEVYLADSRYGRTDTAFPVGKGDRLADVLRRRHEGRGVAAVSVHDVIVLADDSGQGSDPFWHLRSGYGFAQFGGLGGAFGLQGGSGGRRGRFAVGFAGDLGLGGNMGGSFAYNRDYVGGGQMGMSFAFNRDYRPALGGGATSADGGAVRRDFADSAFWTADLRTNAAGEATAAFKLPDSLTTWRVVVTAVTPRTHVGTATARIKTSRPVMVWPMLPRAFVEGDAVRVFGTVHNLGDAEQPVRVRLTAENGRVTSPAEVTVRVPAGGSVPVYWTFEPGPAGWADLLMAADAPNGSDASLKRLPVLSAGVEERAAASGLVGRDELTLTLPAGFDPAKASATVTVAPSLAGDLLDTLPYLVEYPYGCVEQTMSRFLPAVRVAQILKQSGVRAPELEAKLPGVAAAGVKRLLELQQSDGGWGWHGGGRTHEMFTPYAMLGLLEAERAGFPVPNESAVARGLARLNSLLSDVDHVLQRNEAGAATAVNDGVYILSVLALRESVPAAWWGRLERLAGDPALSDYGHALGLELAVRAGNGPLAERLAAELRKRARRADDRAYWTTAGFSRWADNTVEVTAAALKALVALDPNDPLVPAVLAYLQTAKRGDRWDSTRDTAAVLYAVCDYLAAVRAPAAGRGTVTVSVNGGAPRSVGLDGPLSRVLALPAADLKAGRNVVAVHSDVAAGTMVRALVRFRRGGPDVPARGHGVTVRRTVEVREPDGSWRELKSGDEVPKGRFVLVRVHARADDGRPLTYALVESPKPACGETVAEGDRRFADLVRGDHVLREDREAATCFHFERADAAVAAGYVFLTEFAGEFRLPPARAELMYAPASCGHSETFRLRVAE